jgi:hypothetical protein
LRHYGSRTSILLVDEIGYLSHYSSNADLLFRVVSRTHKKRSLVLTPNLAFSDWPTIFPNATSGRPHSIASSTTPTFSRSKARVGAAASPKRASVKGALKPKADRTLPVQICAHPHARQQTLTLQGCANGR